MGPLYPLKPLQAKAQNYFQLFGKRLEGRADKGASEETLRKATMNHTLFLVATLSLLSLSGCNPRSDITFNDKEFVSKDAVFFPTIRIFDLDLDGFADDSITSISILIGEKEGPGEEPKDVCKLAALIGANNGVPTSAPGTDLIFIKANRFHLNRTNVPFVEGDFLTGGPLTDADGNLIEGAATVTSVLKENIDLFFNVLSEGFGTLHLQRLSEDSLNAEFVDTPFLFIREKEDGGFETVEEDSFLEGSIKRAKLCPALATFTTTFFVL